MLAELGEIGMKLAREVGRQALGAAGPDAAEPDAAGRDMAGGVSASLALVFSRIARAVRQTVALEARLDAEAHAQAQLGTAAQAGRAAAQRARDKQQKARVRGFVEEAIAAEADRSDAESLLLDLDERLEDPDIEAELAQRPIGVIVAGICADLGITVDLSHFSDAELGFDRADASQGARSGDGTGGDGAGADATCASPPAVLAADFVVDPGSPPPPLCPSPWPPRVAMGRDPP